MRDARARLAAANLLLVQLRAVGAYAVTGKLGEGGMGVVLRARHPKLPIEVAVKLLKASAVDDEALARFRAEVLALARVHHPNVVPVLDAGRAEDGSPYYVMPLVAGRSLESLLETKGPFQPARAAAIVAKVAHAVHAAHVTAAVVHRDLKPSNVLVEDGTGEPKLFDFGVAKTATAEGERARTETGVVVGTPEYMAPEQASGENALVDARTDVYGLGAMLYALLSGHPPFQRKGRPAALLLADVCLKEPPSLAKGRRNLPRDLVAICGQAMAKERERRYPSALDLALDLERFGRGESVVARPPGVGARVGRWLGRHRGGVLVTATLVFATLVAAVVAQSRALVLSKRLIVPATLADARRDVLDGAFIDASGRPQGRVVEARASIAAACSLVAFLERPEQRVASLAEASRLLLDLNLPREAEPVLDRAAREFPASLEILEVQHDLAHRLHRSCAPVRARIHELCARTPDDPDELAARAEEALDRPEPDFPTARRLVMGVGSRARVLKYLHVVRARLFLTDPFNPSAPSATADLIAALGETAGDPVELADEALALRRIWQWRQARDTARRALERDTALPSAWRTLAEEQLLACELGDAEASWTRWRELAPEDPLVDPLGARLLALCGKPDRAIEVAARALASARLSPGLRCVALAARGTAWLGKDDPERAIADFKEAERTFHETVVEARRDSDAIDYLEGVSGVFAAEATHAFVAIQLGRVVEAQAEFRNALEVMPLCPDDPFTRLVVARTAIPLGKTKSLRRMFDAIEKIYGQGGLELPEAVGKPMAEIERELGPER